MRRSTLASAALLLLCGVCALALRKDGGVRQRSSERVLALDASDHVGEEEPPLRAARAKRSAKDKEEDPISPMTSTFHLNNSHLSLMVNWVGKESSVVFCLARDQEMNENATSNVRLDFRPSLFSWEDTY